MKRTEQAQTYFNATPAFAAAAKPAAPLASRQIVSDRRAPDPSSVLRSDRYPIPSFFEYRMRTGH